MPQHGSSLPPAIAIDGLVRRFGELTAVDGLDLQVAQGQTLALLGPNGAGKTTTIECLEGYLKPHAGTVRIFGLDPIADAAQLRPRMGIMLQEGGLYPTAYPREVLALFAKFHRAPLDVNALLERVGLDRDQRTRCRDLSGGQRQRLSLAMALVGRPDILFLDEPTAGLDPAARRVTWELVAELQQDGVTVVLSTHLLDEAEQLADRVAIVDRGRLVALGTPDELTHGAQSEILFTARPSLDLAGLAARLAASVREQRPGRYVIDAENTPELIVTLATWLAEHGERLGELQAGKRSLEAVFLKLTDEQLATSASDATSGAGSPHAEVAS
jgi:ABC-2 type transport system ATP-binding protein